MTTKVGIIEQIGESGLLLPELINRGLAANDRLKYYLTLLQAAQAHALQPRQTASSLQGEREASGVDDAALDSVVAESQMLPDGAIVVPGARRIVGRLFEDLQQMLQPLRAAPLTSGEDADRLDEYIRRIDEQVDQAPACADDRITPAEIDALTAAGSDGTDTVHQLVMDLHRELNRLQAVVARESIDGARAYGLREADRPLVRAFMRGVNETAALKFDHPGLGTTATVIGERLSIQNDLGTTDAHVVVVHVEGLTATVIYTDVHPKRLRFFRNMLQAYDVAWQRNAAPAGADYEMAVGRYVAKDREALEQYLAHLGSRLVFLIDWNRARKRLARFVKKSDAVTVLRAAADANVGHRGFLQAGDTRLVYTALERAAPAQMRYGARLDEFLGREAARAFLTSVLRVASEGLKADRSQRLIQDEIEAELLTYLQASERSTLGMAAEHAMLISALAERLRRTLVRARQRRGLDEAARTAALAKSWETRADEIVNRSSRVLDQTSEGQVLTRLLSQADDVADALEEAAFLLTLAPEDSDPRDITAIADLADLVSRSAKEYVRCLEYARDLSRAPSRPEIEEFLVAVDRLGQLEHEADAAERAVKAQLIDRAADFRELHVFSEIARGFEQAADALARCGQIVRDYVLSAASGTS